MELLVLAWIVLPWPLGMLVGRLLREHQLSYEDPFKEARLNGQAIHRGYLAKDGG